MDFALMVCNNTNRQRKQILCRYSCARHIFAKNAEKSTVCPFSVRLYGNDEEDQRADESQRDGNDFLFGRLTRAEKGDQRGNDDADRGHERTVQAEEDAELI